MSIQASFVTVEDGDDLVVSFGIGRYSEKSLTLLRTPKFESFLPDEERGVSVVIGISECSERELLLSVQWHDMSVQIESNLRVYELDIRSIDVEEITGAKALLKKMNFDNRFSINGV